MADSLPKEVWGNITSFLDNDDLARFRQLCKATHFVGSDAIILQPFYNRLYTIDKTFSPILPQEGALGVFKQAYEKIQARQQSEITYLASHHPVLMTKLEYTQVLQENTTVSLKSLEARNTLLDEINSVIIKEKIKVNSTNLNLCSAHITRLPITLFQLEDYVSFWQNLTLLDCCNNQLTSLNVQGLVALQALWCTDNQVTMLNVQGVAALQTLACYKNQLTALNVQGLTKLQKLLCGDNQLTILDLQGLVALETFVCIMNPLKTLTLTGVPTNTKNQHAQLEKRLLFNQLHQPVSDEAKQEIITKLGTNSRDGAGIRACALVSTDLSQNSTFLPSFSLEKNINKPEIAELKRQRDGNGMRINDRPEEPDNESDFKRIKKG